MYNQNRKSMKKTLLALCCLSAIFVSCDKLNKGNANGGQPAGNESVESVEVADAPQTVDGIAEDEKITLENCIPGLKRDFNLVLQLPAASSINKYSELSFDWSVMVSSEDAEKDAMEVAQSLFDQTKKLSVNGIYSGKVDVDEESYKPVFFKKGDLANLAEAKISEMADYKQYQWFYKSNEDVVTEVFVDYNTAKNEYTICLGNTLVKDRFKE